MHVRCRWGLELSKESELPEGFVQERMGKAPRTLDWEDLGAPVISAFLDHIEADRGNSARSRNTRLAAVRSLFRYASAKLRAR